MANPGVGTKFVSVNLNKSYGQRPTNSARSRPSHHVGVGTGSGGGMVVLSRTRGGVSGAAKPGPKLSVPPPLNLPSLRKEHERFDQSSALGGSAGVRNVGPGSGHGSSVVGWMRPGLSGTLLEKDGSGARTEQMGDGLMVSSPGDGSAGGGGGTYVPPAARVGTVGQQQQRQQQAVMLSRNTMSVDKAVVLRGEDFPTLRATLPSALPSAQKQKDALQQKQNRGEEVLQEKTGSVDSPLSLQMRPQVNSSRLVVGNRLDENSISSHASSGGLNSKEQSRKLDRFLPGPLPLVKLNHTSDWEDDERDTGHGIPKQALNPRFVRNESILDRGLDAPRVNLSQSLVHNLSDGRRIRDTEANKVGSSWEVPIGYPHSRDVKTSSREGRDGNSWRASSSLAKVVSGGREIGVDRNGIGARPFSPSRDVGRDNKYSESNYRDSNGNGSRNTVNGHQDSRYGRRDSVYGTSGQNGNRSVEAFNSRGDEQNLHGHYGGDILKRNRGAVFQNSSMAKTSFSLGSKGLPVNDPILNFNREKRLFSNSGKPYMDDTFDMRNPFSGGLIADAKIFRRKKDPLKQADFHDPVRESFEAELERVQKLQEQERQRIAEEQARALEHARREEEERQRLAREEEEHRRRLEEEAREAAWRAEQERLEAVKRADEQKMAREEEKRRIFLEEERRKEAARKKLLELEARIARRQAEGAKDDTSSTFVGDERISGMLKGRDGLRIANLGDWEDGERMVERITHSASSDSSSLNRSIETGSRPHSSRDGNSVLLDRGKASNFWNRDAFENGSGSTFLSNDHLNGHRSKRDGLGAGRAFPRKDFYVGPGPGPGALSSRISTKSGMPESHMFDDYPHPRGNKWNVGGDGDHYNRNSEVDTEFPDNQMDRFGDIGWGHSRSRGSLNTPYMDRFIQNTEVDGFSSFGRSRHSMRQPRVLPPPSLSSLHGSSFRAESERFGSSVFLDDESKHVRTTQMNEHNFQAGYESGYQERTDRPGAVGENQRNIISNEQIDEKNPPRCESQSSLSVSSPPDSPTHLSHDDLDDSGDFPVQAADNGKLEAFAENEHNAASEENVNVMDTSMSVAPGEDEEWAVHDGEDLQEQEEYDEEEEGFQEEDEVHEDDDDNLDLAREFEKLHSEEQEPTGKIGQMVLGFDEGVEVEIPGDDEFGDSPKNGEKTIEVQSVFGGISHDGLVGNEDSVQSENVLTEGSKENSKMIHESEKSLQDLTIQSSVVSASSLLDGVDVPSSSHIPDEPTVASPPNLTMHCQPVQPVLPKVSSVPSQAEVPPVKLQFGLFSGPTLIPSPVPAIQIGSIQMPLLRPPVGPSLTQLHSAQPPFFQFGQLRYTSAISQGISPLAPQTLSLAQPTIPAHYSLNQNPGGSLHNQAALDTSTHGSHLNDAGFVLMDNQPSPAHNLLDSSNESTSNEKNPLFVKDSMDNEVFPSQDQEEGSYLVENKMLSASVSQVEDQGHHGLTFEKNYKPMAGKRAIPGQKHKEASSSQFVSSERAFVSSKAPGSVPGSKGKRFIYAVRNTDSVLSVPVIESSHAESSGYQRRARRNIRRPEFRVRESVNGRQSESLVSSRVDEKSNFNRKVLGTSMKSGYKKDMFVNKSTKALVDSETFPVSGSLSSRVVDADGMLDRKLVKMAASKRLISTSKTSQSGEGNVTSSDISQEDVDAPLQSGVVCVFQQPGIEAPSDEDDFIEVRSKRQMLNDRREQREKEIKAKSKAIKAPRKPRSVSQTVTVPTTSSRTATPLSAEPVNCVHSEPVVSEGWASANDEVSTGFTNGIVSPPLPPIGTPSSTDTQFNGRSLTTKSVKTSSVPVISSVGTNLVPGLSFEDNVITPFGSWANVCIGQQVMALTQNQLDEAMKPAQFDTHVAPIVDHTVVVLESEKPSTSILTQDKSFTSSASPVSSLLAGEKIQFGAVTSPTVLPPSSLPVSSIGPPGSCISVDHNLSSPDGGCMIFFDKEKQPNGSRVQLEDPEAEAEAEAAASAVAVAAISSDELVGSGLDSSSVSVSGTKSFGGADVVSLSSGCGTGDQQLPSQSRGEESLTVALPADLSVDTPSLSLWPPLPSPHNSSGPMLSHFPGAPPSHFPCFEMNPMFGGPVFAFGPHDESASNQPQSQKSNTAATGSLGTWQPCHSGVDSFYGPPAGFTAPFISPGGIPGVQGPPHMVVYNHFTPVGQFGQVGLSFMGTTYIPSGKQPDWKHTPGTSAVGVSEGDIHNLNAAAGQHNPPNVPTPIQHLSPGSPLLPVASPFAMFDLSPFQSSADVPVQARWTHVPSSPLHPVPPMPSLQQQADGGLPSQYTHGLPVDTSNVTTFQESRSSTLANDNRSFPPVSGSATRLPDELGLMDPSSATAARVPTSRPTSYASVDGNVKVENMTKSSSRGSVSDASQSGIIGNDSSSSNSCGSSTSTSTLKAQPNSSAPHFLQPIGYTEQRGGGISQKIVSGGDWHRRSGFQGRNQSTGPDKNFASSKMKQIYVAKAASSVPTTTD